MATLDDKKESVKARTKLFWYGAGTALCAGHCLFLIEAAILGSLPHIWQMRAGSLIFLLVMGGGFTMMYFMVDDDRAIKQEDYKERCHLAAYDKLIHSPNIVSIPFDNRDHRAHQQDVAAKQKWCDENVGGYQIVHGYFVIYFVFEDVKSAVLFKMFAS